MQHLVVELRSFISWVFLGNYSMRYGHMDYRIHVIWDSLPNMSKKAFRNQKAIQTVNPAAPAVNTSAPNNHIHTLHHLDQEILSVYRVH